MKSILAAGSLATLFLASSTVGAVVCSFLLPAKFENPFAATALSGYYLEAGSDGSAKLVNGQDLVAVRYGSNAPLGRAVLDSTPRDRPHYRGDCPGDRPLTF